MWPHDDQRIGELVASVIVEVFKAIAGSILTGVACALLSALVTKKLRAK